MPQLGISEHAPRVLSARLGKELLARLANENDDVVLVQTLFELALPEEPQALAKSMTSASTVAGALRGLMWSMIDSVRAIDATDPRRPEVDVLIATLAQTAEAEEHHAALAPALRAAVEKAGQILAAAQTTPTPPAPTPPVPTPPSLTLPEPPTGPTSLPAQTVDDVPLEGIDDVFTEAMHEARAALQQNPGRRLKVRWWLE